MMQGPQHRSAQKKAQVFFMNYKQNVKYVPNIVLKFNKSNKNASILQLGEH